ncbi:MAG: NUDIX hydrolase N-terminal domain-containing protein [Clostridiales bacterium]|nr:NUDIX hydrolase N-terminal domain-containing protein [Clostridiales bacterium]
MENKRLSEIAHELAAIASAGKWYTHNKFDIEHYENILKLSRELLTIGTDIAPEKAEELLEGNDGYQTPKVETRAVIFNEKEEVLLVKDFDGKWNPPGGWCEFNLPIGANAVKEAFEEAGIKAEPYRLAAVLDHRKNNNPNSMFSSCKCFILCRDLGGEFAPNIETTEARYFPMDGLPELNTHKCSPAQLELCLKAFRAETWETVFD